MVGKVVNLDRVGPIDNRLSTDLLHQIVKTKKLFFLDFFLLFLTSDM